MLIASAPIGVVITRVPALGGLRTIYSAATIVTAWNDMRSTPFRWRAQSTTAPGRQFNNSISSPGDKKVPMIVKNPIFLPAWAAVFPDKGFGESTICEATGPVPN